jgi:uncharacterized coiled-coil protein SlyX
VVARGTSRESSINEFFACFIYSRRTQVAETFDNKPQAEVPNLETPRDQQPVALSLPSSGWPAVLGALSALIVIGAMTIYDLPKFDRVLPNFTGIAELFPHETASAPIPDPVVVMLKELRSAQQENAAAVQESGAVLKQNTVMLQQGTMTLDSLKQGVAAQQTSLKTLTNQLSSLVARVDSLQNAMEPQTTSSISRPTARVRSVVTSRKRSSEPVGPVSVGGAPLRAVPGAG